MLRIILDEDRNGGALETVHEEVQAWITKEKLYSSLPDLLAARSIYTLDQVRSMSHDLICEIGNALKPLPNKRFIKAIYELKTLVETKKVEMPGKLRFQCVSNRGQMPKRITI
ncbi:hypothetical protein EON65_21015 [archaeon]|nr:MAG: hypothetical protein EON65_21015 [archaeon]